MHESGCYEICAPNLASRPILPHAKLLKYGFSDPRLRCRENITGTPFPNLVTDQILKPLNLTRTFLSHPGNDTNAVVYDGWDLDFGDESP